ncbi:hypothetical protein BC629DRAFT_1439926 [Irpex lacteus]|nr:hypothetical protein BC629DRAFT_1439926 [Irpex lacteus]
MPVCLWCQAATWENAPKLISALVIMIDTSLRQYSPREVSAGLVAIYKAFVEALNGGRKSGYVPNKGAHALYSVGEVEQLCETSFIAVWVGGRDIWRNSGIGLSGSRLIRLYMVRSSNAAASLLVTINCRGVGETHSYYRLPDLSRTPSVYTKEVQVKDGVDVDPAQTPLPAIVRAS